MTHPADASPRVRTVFIGTGTFGLDALRFLTASPEVEIVGIVTAPPRAAGRGGALRPSPVEDAARDLGMAEIQAPERLRRPEAVAAVLALRPDLVVLADYGQIVPPALLGVRHGALNLHPSLLPRHRGASPIPATILAGDARTGVALMRMDDGLDTGPIVAIDEMPLDGTETAPELEAVLAARGAQLLGRCLPGWIEGELSGRPQAGAGATLTRPLRRDDGRLDPLRPAELLERQVRAFQPWPGSWFEVSTGRLTVWRAAVRADLPGAAPGELRADGRALVLQASHGALDLLEIQPAGGRRMSADELLRGRPGLSGQRVRPLPAGVEPRPIERPIDRPVERSVEGLVG